MVVRRLGGALSLSDGELESLGGGAPDGDVAASADVECVVEFLPPELKRGGGGRLTAFSTR